MTANIPRQPLDREALFVALAARLAAITSPNIVTVSRVLIDFENAAPVQQPAIYIVKGHETNLEKNPSRPPRWKIEAELVVFCRNDADPNAPPSTQLNALLTGIEGSLIRSPTEGFVIGQPYAQTNEWWTSLDGLCSHCMISGDIIVGEGASGGQAVALVPIEILVSP